MGGYIGQGGGGLNTGANPFDKKKGGKLGDWDVVGNALDKGNPYVGGAKAADEKAADYAKSSEQQYKDTQDVLGHMDRSGNDYYGQMQNAYTGGGGYQEKMNDASNNYASYVQKLQKETEGQAKDAKAVYSNDILPKMKDNMQHAMTLQQSMDPNNPVAQATRKLYGDQAAGIGRQGLADAGVLQAMGTQATMGQLGEAGPMTGGQIAALQGANLGQSGAAMARAQQRANDLRQQGVQAGFDRTDMAYNNGQKAIGDYEASNNRMDAQQTGYRNQAYGMGQDIFGTRMGQANANLGIGTGLAGLKYGLDAQGQNRQLASINDKYGRTQGNIINGLNAQNAQNQATIGAMGTLGGAMIGGVGGAAAAHAAQQPDPAGNHGQGYETPATQTPYAGANPYTPPAGAANGGAVAGAGPGGTYDGGYSSSVGRGYSPYERNPYNTQR